MAFLLSWPYDLVDLNRLTNSPPIRRSRPIASQREVSSNRSASSRQARPRTVDITSVMPTGAEFHFILVRQMVSHAARCVACHGVRSHAVPVALVGECSVPE